MFPRIRKGFLLCGFDWKENPEKELRQWKKISLSRKRNLCVCVSEKKQQFLRYIRNVNLPFKKDFKLFERIYAKATKHASKMMAKAKVNLN